MDERELLTLWHEGLRIAQRCCARTLGRLRDGEGGFYEADDLLQDLFLDFWGVAQSWHAAGSGDQAALWEAWRRRLSHGGARILRRAPQRLWGGAEIATPPEVFAAPEEADERSARLLRAIERALTQCDDAPTACEQREALDDVAQALEGMPAARAHCLTMTALQGRPADEVAETLGLPGAHSVYAQVRQARAGLARLRR